MIFRQVKNFLGNSIFSLGALISLALLIFVIYKVFSLGVGAISWDFITKPSETFGLSGGIFFQILGTGILSFFAMVFSLPAALAVALYCSEYLSKTSKFQNGIRLLFYGLNAMPTIIFGLIGYLIFCHYLGFGVSWLSGSLILAMMALPTLFITISEAIEAIPESYRRLALGLGFSKEQVIKTVVLPYSRNGIITGSILAIGRITGETAAIMFTATAIVGGTFPKSLFEPVASIQTHILYLTQEVFYPMAKQNAWGSALVLMMIILVINTISLLFRRKIKRVEHA